MGILSWFRPKSKASKEIQNPNVVSINILFSADQEIAQLLIKQEIELPEDGINSKEAEKIAKEIGKAVRTKSPKEILRTLKKYDFKTITDLDPFDIKQAYYLSKIENQTIRKKIASLPKIRLPILLKSVLRNSTEDLIKQLNEAIKKQNIKRLENLLPKLKITDKQQIKEINNIANKNNPIDQHNELLAQDMRLKNGNQTPIDEKEFDSDQEKEKSSSDQQHRG